MSEDIAQQKLLYHLTRIENIPSIFEQGLKPRCEIDNFLDVADQEIIEGRKSLQLEKFVPFHWFSRNPFDGRVQEDNPNNTFSLISVKRTFAREKNWKIIPHHPLSSNEISLLDYDDGFSQIDWKTMNLRNYRDPHCKSVCMAECLSPQTVNPNEFFKIFVDSDRSERYVRKNALLHKRKIEVSINRYMFIP